MPLSFVKLNYIKISSLSFDKSNRQRLSEHSLCVENIMGYDKSVIFSTHIESD